MPDKKLHLIRIQEFLLKLTLTIYSANVKSHIFDTFTVIVAFLLQIPFLGTKFFQFKTIDAFSWF